MLCSHLESFRPSSALLGLPGERVVLSSSAGEEVSEQPDEL